MDQENKPIRRKFPYEPSQELKKSEFISLSQRKKLSAKKEEETQKVQNYDNMIIETHIQPGIIYSTPIPQNFISDEDDTNNMQPLKPFTEGCLGNSVTDLFKKEREEEEKMYKKEEEILKGNQEVIDEINKKLATLNLLIIERERLKVQFTTAHNLTILKDNYRKEEFKRQKAYEDLIKSKVTESDLLIEKMQQLNLSIEDEIKGKDKEISEKQALLNAMNSKEFDISAIEKSVTNDNTNLQLEIKKANLRLNHVQSALQSYKNKIDEHNKNRIETLSHIITLKPYYKKFFILRKSNETIHNVSIHKNRKSIELNKNEFKFDFIISTLFNCYIPKSLQNEDDSKYISNELFNIVHPYVIQFSSLNNEEKNYFLLYMSKISNRKQMNSHILFLIQNLLTHFTDLQLSIKIILKEIIINLLSEGEAFNENAIAQKIQSIEQDTFGFVYSLQRENNKSKFEIVDLDYSSKGISAILSKMNESNVAVKKKKVNVSTKNKLPMTPPSNTKVYNIMNKDLSTILQELNTLNPYHSASFLDISESEMQTNEVKTVLSELNQ